MEQRHCDFQRFPWYLHVPRVSVELCTYIIKLPYTSGVTTALQKRGIDFVNVRNQIQVLIGTLESTRQRANEFHEEILIKPCELVGLLDVDINPLTVAGHDCGPLE